MKINNDLYGGFIVSKNALKGIPILYSYRQKSSIKELNGWNILSEIDDENYVSESSNFLIVNAESIYKIAPVLFEIFDADYGTDLFWKYQENVHIGFYDLINECDTDIDQILKKK
ncbi:immunity protein Imm33 domain-containing protein [Flavobacterium sharifuzzamanii]|uniref:immunity protein Imm33 domain-containing protein n=1 Tax=Flavobacterium sharifuzzamanii TaxID=2211133 RepID=UPI000DAF21C1|nr:DUF2185 domain-containing protein [Flavobacterium sharifuzzamanii]KAF2083070.1 DUF2185 domain-containing protein [Flavobacterium sharifuzzamanii]